MKMRFGHIEIFVSDPLRSLEFYKTVLGFEVFDVQAEKYVWMKMGEVEILLRPGMPQEQAKRYEEGGMGIVLYTDGLDATLERMKEHGVDTDPAADSAKCRTFTDPDGNWIQLVDPTDM